MAKRTWTIDPTHTQIEFSVKHMMFTTVRGRFARFDGVVSLDERASKDSGVEITIDAESLDTGVEARDNHLRSADFFDVARHPQLTFRSTQVNGSLTPGAAFVVEGDLTIRGVTRPVTLQATFDGIGVDPWGGTRAGFSASGTVDRRDFDLTWNQALETGGLLVGNEVKITLQVQAVRQEAAAVA